MEAGQFCSSLLEKTNFQNVEVCVCHAEPFAVILSEAKNPGISLRINSAKHPGICESSKYGGPSSPAAPQDDKLQSFQQTVQIGM